MTRTFSWGYRIALLYGGFVVLMVVLVSASMRQNFDLVSRDYYKEEIQFQQTIDAGKNQSMLSAPVLLKNEDGFFKLDFPREFESKNIEGSIHFYSVVDAGRDRKFPIKSSDGTWQVLLSELAGPSYICKINWECEGKAYYQESKFRSVTP